MSQLLLRHQLLIWDDREGHAVRRADFDVLSTEVYRGGTSVQHCNVKCDPAIGSGYFRHSDHRGATFIIELGHALLIPRRLLRSQRRSDKELGTSINLSTIPV
jgi:hypothetical protein